MKASATPGPAAARAGLVRDNLQQPGSKGTTRIKARQRPPGVDEAILNRVLRITGMPGDDVSQSQRRRLMLAQQPSKRIHVPALRPLDYGSFIHAVH